MKIGIVTITDYSNFGNRLQTFAVCRVLKNRFGCDAVSLEKPHRKNGFVSGLKELLCLCPAVAEKCFGSNITRANNFHTWSRRHIPVKNFDRNTPLPKTLNDEFDLFLAGSDQIWNYTFASKRFDDYFLTFAEPGKRAAISASFGVKEIPEAWKQRYIDGLSGFDHISVRENAGQKIIMELVKRNVPVLVDPVMLLSREEWLQVARKPRVDCAKPYILKCYLGDEYEGDVLGRWAQENGYAVYELMNDSSPQLHSAGPGEFLSLIDNASLVCSDSFHCIAFSIIFGRPFIAYERQGEEGSMTSRLDTLLCKFGLESRWKHLLTPEQYMQCDFSHIGDILQAEQEKTFDYIHTILSKTKSEVPCNIIMASDE